MPAEKVLIDYIRKARLAGQSDEQSRILLYKNGWTEEEVNEAIAELDKEEQKTAAPQEVLTSEVTSLPEERKESETEKEHQVSGKPEIKTKEEKDFFTHQEEIKEKIFQQASQASSQPIQSPQSFQSTTPSQSLEHSFPLPTSQEKIEQISREHPKIKGRIGKLILNLIIIVILITLIIAGLYVAFFQQNILEKLMNIFKGPVSQQQEISQPLTQQESKETPSFQQPTIQEKIIPLKLLNRSLGTVSSEYDFTKVKVAGFNQNGNKVAYCATKKDNIYKISCFINDNKLFDSPYSFAPYWIGISPNEERIIFLYYDSLKKQSFIFENGKEGKRFNGTITWPTFSPDSKLFLYMVMGNDGKNFIVIEDKEGKHYDKIYTPPQFSEDGKYIFYGARNGNEIIWVVDKVEEILKPTSQNEGNSFNTKKEESSAGSLPEVEGVR